MERQCERCAHFRPRRSLTECLRLSTSLGVAQVIQNVMQTEQALLAKETAWKVELMPHREQWPFKPQVEAYCGFREDQDVYLVHEVKNADGLCRDFRPDSEQPQRRCTMCVHHVAASGAAQDHRNLMDAISPATNWYQNADGSSRSGQITNDVQTLMQVSQGQQAQEMLMALNGGGTMPRLPQYYDYCRKYSSQNKYVLCAMQNPQNRCGGWSGHSISGPQTRPWTTPAPTTPPPSGPAGGGTVGGSSNATGSVFFRTLARRLAEELKKR